MSNYYSYMRISTKEANDKQSFSRQDKGLKAYAETNGIEYLLIFKDDTTGSTFDRAQWNKLEKLLQKGDTVVFKEISRFTRQANEGYTKFMELMDKGINLIFIDNMTVSTDYIKKLCNVASEQDLVAKTALEGIIKLLLIVELDRVQQEREIIVKRIKQGIEASDNKSGRATGNLDKMSDELKADIVEFITNRSIKQVDLMSKYNISRNTLKKYIAIINEGSEGTN
jgi:DNA invertase Pin-like site-specific DNA recombinase